MTPLHKQLWVGGHIAFIEALIIAISFLISYYLRYDVQFLRPVDEANAAPFAPFIPYTLIFLVWMLLANYGAGLYQDERDRTLAEEVVKIGNATSNAAIVLMALSFLLRPLVFSRLMIVQAAIISLLLLMVFRWLLRLLRNYLHRRGVGIETVLVVGGGEIGRHVIRTIVARPALGMRLLGFLDDDPERGSKPLGRVLALGSIDQLEKIIDNQRVDLVIVTLPWKSQRRILQIVEECQNKNARVLVVPDLFQLNMAHIQVDMLGGLPLLSARRPTDFRRAQLLMKRVMDFVIILVALPVVLPIALLTALVIRLDSKGDVLFYQTRIGYKGKPFKMIKFRSMVTNAEDLQDQVVVRTADDPEGKLQRKDDDPRITRVGRFIRRTSIDELPQLINVLRGEMSLVGPRPALPQEIALYKAWHHQRLGALPGITGLWQVSGRSDIPFEEKVLLDIYYIENWSLGLDIQIALQTVPEVLFSRGAY